MATWIAQAGSNSAAHNWNYLAASADAQTILASSQLGLSLSRDGGATWATTQPSSLTSWKGVAVGRTGVHMAAVTDGAGIFVSHDSGATWVKKNAATTRWTRVGISSDGNTIMAGSNQAAPLKSTDGGTTWATVAGVGTDSIAVAVSGNGLVLAVGPFSSSYMWVSPDGGNTWTKSNLQEQIQDFTITPDGSRIVGGTYSDYVITTQDKGATWVKLTKSPAAQVWNAVSVSDDGNTIVASYSTNVYISKDAGNTWTAQTIGGTTAVTGVATSANGLKFAAARSGAAVYTLDTTPVYPAQTWKNMYFGSKQVQALYLGANQFWAHP